MIGLRAYLHSISQSEREERSEPVFLNVYEAQEEPKTNNSLSFPSKINIDDKVNKNRTNVGDCVAKMEAIIIHSN